MDKQQLKNRTKAFTLKVIEFHESLSKKRAAQIIGDQLLRAATSVAANYRASCRSRSYAEFISKIGLVEEEADECSFWLELITESGVSPESVAGPLAQEADELTAIFTATGRTAKLKSPRKVDLLSKIRNPKSEIRNPS